MVPKPPVRSIKELFTHIKKKGFHSCLEKASFVSEENGRCIFEMKVDEEHSNLQGTLHGGLTATLVDAITTYALMSTGSHHGASIDLSVRYLRPAKLGEHILIDGYVVKSGKTLAFLEAEVRRKEDGAVVAKATHTKAIPAGKTAADETITTK